MRMCSLHQPGTLQHVAPGVAQLARGHVRKARLHRLLDHHPRAQEVAPEQRQCIQPRGGELHLLVLEQAPHQLGARVFRLGAFGAAAHRQQHARLDLDQHCRHQQVLGGELEIALADLLDVGQVLARHVGERDVEDVEVLAPDQVEQQVQRSLEGFEKDLERIGRDVEVCRQREQRLAIEAGERNLVDGFG